jgi:membrane associated rhomboid family serine protease
MLPIRDHNPVRTTPVVTWVVIAAAAWIFFFVQPRPDREAFAFLVEEATIPCEVVTIQPVSIDELTTGVCSRAGEPEFPGKNIMFSLVASIFFHGGVGHLLGNLWVLWIFGNNVEDEFGHNRYAVFYLVSGVLAGLSHVALNPTSTIPVVGASGAIAGVMGAYLVLHPSARVTAIVPPLFFLPFRVPAALFLGIWLLGQFGLAGAATNIAWEAHVGGFIVGVLYGLRFRRRRRPRRSPEPPAGRRR